MLYKVDTVYWLSLSRCFCQRNTHIAISCGSHLNRGGANTFPGVCNRCGKYGHRLRDCRVKGAGMRRNRVGKGGFGLEEGEEGVSAE